ncbi:MAG TPA: hypothetical protein PKA64_15090 [Myxococcota bacterium]|nr:hypothetical protein [Myxococcota bacterium]
MVRNTAGAAPGTTRAISALLPNAGHRHLDQPLDRGPRGGPHERGEELPADELVDARVIGRHRAGGLGARRHDREVVGDLRSIEHQLDVLEALGLDARGDGAELCVAGQLADHALHGLEVVGRQVPAVRAGVGQDLVGLVQALGRVEGALGREREPAVGLALQRRQVERQRRRLAALAPLLAGRTGAGGAHGLEHGVDPRAVEHTAWTLVPILGVDHRGIVVAAGPRVAGAFERRVDLPVGRGLVREDLALALHEQAQRGRLHAPGRPHALLLAALQAASERARRVHADEPVPHAAQPGGVGEVVELGPRAQRREARADRVVRHRLQP